MIFKNDKGNQILLKDLKGVTGEYNWKIMEGKYIPNEAKQLHKEARHHGGKGEFYLSIEKLIKGNQLAPEWAYTIYNLAYTYLLQKDFTNTLK